MKPTPEELTDALLRQRLSQAAPPPPPADGWQRLDARLNADPDIVLRESLTGLSPAVASNWDALERELDGNAAGDSVVADKLNALQPLPAAGAWAAFADKMDARNAEVVDVIVGDQLSRAGAGAVSGWSALAARLELIRDRRQRIYAGAVIELSLMLSLLLLLVRFGPTQPPNASPGPLAAGFPMATVEVGNMATKSTPLNGVEASLLANGSLAVKGGNAQNASGQLDMAVSLVAERVSFSGLASESHVQGISPDRPETADSPVTIDEVKTYQPTPASQLLPTEPVVPESQLAANLPQPALRLAPVTKEKLPTILYAHAFLSPVDANQVITRTLPVNNFDVTADNRVTQGHSAGMLLDLMQGGFGVQLGVVYSRISYIPSALKYYLEEEYPLVEAPRGYSRFVFRKLTLPFSFNQVISQSDNWRWTARATMSVSIAGTTNFNISEEDRDYIEVFNREVDNGQLPTTAADASGRSSDARVWYKLIDPAPGAFQGGSLFDNANFYVGGGIMLERLLGPRSSVYVNPSFGRVIYLNPDREDSGTGPYQDKIHTGQLRFGARYRLGKGQ